MATVMSVGNSEGTRRCDSRCHNAKGPVCTCVCDGRNHGVGLTQAIQNTRKMVEEQFGDDLVRYAEEAYRVVIPNGLPHMEAV